MDDKVKSGKVKKAKPKNQKNAKPNFLDCILYDIAFKIAKKWDREEKERLDKKALPDGVTEIRDICFDEGDPKARTLDIYFKDKKAGKPILIDIHGGAFVSGSKESDRLFGNAMATLGFLVFNLNYKLAPKKANVFKQIEDVHYATEWIIKNAKTYGGDLKNIYFAGHSAGAVLSVAEILLSLDDEMREVYKLPKLEFEAKGAILDSGFMRFYQNLLPYQMTRRVVFPPKFEKDARYKFLLFDKNEKLKLLPKIFLVTNEDDGLRQMSYYFDALLQKVGVPHKLNSKSTGGHVGIIFDPLCVENKAVLLEAKRFFEIL